MELINNTKKEEGEEEYVNKDMISRIDKIEDQMMNTKTWQMTGEVLSKERPLNSLLEVHLDFNVASKLPPLIT